MEIVSGALIGISWIVFLVLLIIFFGLSSETVRLRLTGWLLLGTWNQPTAAVALRVHHSVFLYGMPSPESETSHDLDRFDDSDNGDFLVHLQTEAISSAVLWRGSTGLVITWRGLAAIARFFITISLPLWSLYLLVGIVQLASTDILNGAQFAEDAFWLLGLLLLPAVFLLWRLPTRFGLSAINDAAAVLCAWLPLEFDWVPQNVIAALNDSDSLPLVEVICLINAVVLFSAIRPTGINSSFSFRAFTFADTYERAYAACAVFFVLGMPLCLVTRFIEWQPTSATFLQFAGLYVLIYFGTAIIEEILFRAVIQSIFEDHIELHWPHLALPSPANHPNIDHHHNHNHENENENENYGQHEVDPDAALDPLEEAASSPHRVLEPWYQRYTHIDDGDNQGLFRRLVSWITLPRSATLALVFASVIFGLAHLDNDTTNYRSPNFLYAFFATFAGALYGWVYRTTGFLTASAITHATVDWMWVVFFN